MPFLDPANLILEHGNSTTLLTDPGNRGLQVTGRIRLAREAPADAAEREIEAAVPTPPGHVRESQDVRAYTGFSETTVDYAITFREKTAGSGR